MLHDTYPSLGACLREAASAKAGEGIEGRGINLPIHPCLPAGPEPNMVQGRQAHPPPSEG